ncbi:MAG: ribonuclease III [Planctomycetota bacterium]
MTPALNRLEKKLGYSFKKKELLTLALTHSSIKDDEHPSNERLEFLGDAVLGLVVTEFTYRSFKELNEGELTTIKSAVVSSSSLLKIANKVQLKEFISVGKGITQKKSIPTSLVANAVEAVIGAIYLDSGYRAAREFILGHIEPMVIKATKKRSNKNYKSLLQNYVQKMFGATPHYNLIDENGPDHKKVFQLSAVINDRVYPAGAGKTKKIASQKAAHAALMILQKKHGKLPQ